MVRNLPASEGVTGLIPGLGGFPMTSKLSPYATNYRVCALERMCHTKKPVCNAARESLWVAMKSQCGKK